MVPAGTKSLRFGGDPRPTNVLQEDPDLASGVPQEQVAAASRASVTVLLHARRGTWDATSDAGRTRGGHGLLVLDGLLVRRLGLGDRWAAELLGPGDLLRPLEHDGDEATLPFEATWGVLIDLRLAVLDRRWSYRMAPFPDVGIRLTARAMLRARRLANTFAIAQQSRLDARLHLLLWELADRYGRVHPDGVHLDLPLTHELLSHIAAARRPSVTSALARLADSGLAERSDTGWLLRGDPPTTSTWKPIRRPSSPGH
jgi:CRP/FNR family transcriptional regulator, cyclic AMP receptor protein